MAVEFLAVVALVTLAFGAISRKAESLPLTPPMFFVLAGLALCPAGLNLAHLEVEGELFTLLAELTLALLLFSDASRMDMGLLRRHHSVPLRMLLIGMPLTILVGTLVGSWLLSDFALWQAAVLAAVLAPTDAALGQAVLSNQKIPLRMRQAINVESGLNDGIALPAVVFLVSCLAGQEVRSWDYWLLFTLQQIALGVLVGIVVGYLGGRLVESASDRGWMNQTFRDLAPIALPLACYALSDLAGGNGFIGAFLGGLAFGIGAPRLCSRVHEFAEAEGQLLTLLVFLVFGGFMIPVAAEGWNLSMLLYALLSLTLIRMLPVVLSLAGKRLRWESLLFLSWFGPRGVASILFALLVVSRAEGPGGPISDVVALTVLISIFAHGLSAAPFARWYGGRLGALEDEEMPEHRQVSSMPLRFGHLAGRSDRSS